MKRASVSFRPEVVMLESRWQPGSLLVTSVESSLLTGGLAPLAFQEQDSQPALTAHQAVNPAETVVLAPATPAQPSGLADPLQTLQGVQQASLANPVVDPVQAVQALQVLPTGQESAPVVKHAPVGGHGGPGIQGGACEDPGNVVSNGDFETGALPPWATTDGFTGVAGPGAPLGDHGPGDLTPTFHLVLGNVGSAGSVNQVVATDVDQVYLVRFSMKLDPIDFNPVVFQIKWNSAVVVDLSTTAPSDVYTRYGADGSLVVVGTGADFLEISARQDPNWWHVDDFCVTPLVK